jgi:hypothetical protein
MLHIIGSMPKHQATHPTGLCVVVTLSEVLPGTPEQVFDFIAAEDVLPRVLTGYGPLPAVVRTSDHTGPWTQPGSARIVHLADGHALREQLTHYTRAHHFAYRIGGFEHPLLRRLALGGQGEWTFAPHAQGTRLAWVYTFHARHAAAAMALRWLARWLWRGYMQVCLSNARRILSEACHCRKLPTAPH